MSRLYCLSVAVACTLLQTLAADEPRSQKAWPRISAANADQVRRVTELERRVDKILLGPAPDELTFVARGDSVEVVDQVNFQPLRKIADGHRPIDFAASRDGRFVTWNEDGSPTYVVQELASDKTVEIHIGKYPGFAAFSPDSRPGPAS